MTSFSILQQYINLNLKKWGKDKNIQHHIDLLLLFMNMILSWIEVVEEIHWLRITLVPSFISYQCIIAFRYIHATE